MPPQDYDALAKKFGGKDVDDLAAKFGGVDVDAPKAAPGKDAPTLAQRARDLVTLPVRVNADLTIGGLKEIGATVNRLGKAASDYVPGLKAGVDALYGTPGLSDRAFAEGARVTEASNATQAAGKLGVGIAKTLVPAAKVTQLAGRAAAAVAPRLALPVRAAIEAAGGAGMAGLDGGSAALGAGIGAAVPVAGGLLRAGGRALGVTTPNPSMQSAIEFARRPDINLPVDAATATGSRLLRRMQNVLGKSTIGGGLVGDKAERARQAGLARVAASLADDAYPVPATASTAGERVQEKTAKSLERGYQRLAGKVSPSPVLPEQAGASLAEEGVRRIKEFGRSADDAYAKFREIESANSTEVATAAQAGGDVFKPKNWSDGALWSEVWRDAKAMGYDGKADDLRTLLRVKVSEAAGAIDAVNDGNWGKQLLQFIRQNGGVGKSSADNQGEIDRLWEMSQSPRGVRDAAVSAAKMQRHAGTIGGVPEVLRRDGLTVGDMMERLRGSEMGDQFMDLPDTELFNIIEEAAALADKVSITPNQALANAGVAPGRAWWTEAGALAGDGADGSALQVLGRASQGVADEAPEAVAVGLPTRMAGVKAALRDVVGIYENALPVDARQADPGLHVIREILDGPDVRSASEAELTIGALKAITRHAAKVPGLRGRSAGLAAKAINEMEAALDGALQAAPEARAALDAGRAATRSKYQAGAVVKELRKEPVQAYRQMVAPADTGIARLRRVSEIAPDELPKVARAWFDETVQARDFGAWTKLGPATKRILFGSDEAVAKLDGYFSRAKRLEAITAGRGGTRGPEALFTRLTTPGDVHVAELRDLGKRMPQLGRAYLDNLFDRATEQSGFHGEAGIYRRWQQMGPQTKAILFPHPQLRKDLDDFFVFAQKSAEDLNPSGTGPIALLGAQGAFSWFNPVKAVAMQMSAWAMSSLLHNPKALRVMSTALNTKASQGARAAAISNQLLQLSGGAAMPVASESPATDPTAGAR